MPVLLELAQPSGGDLRALLQRRHAADLALASRLIVNSGRIDDVIEVARQYAVKAEAAIAEVPRAAHLSRFPPSYVDWALEQFVAA
jgi:geranylgeranyl pyrophosphate synthase